LGCVSKVQGEGEGEAMPSQPCQSRILMR